MTARSALSDFNTEVLKLNPLVYTPFFLGKMVDRSSFGRTLSISVASPEWLKLADGYSLKCRQTNSRVSIPHAADLNTNERTLVVFSPEFRQDGVNQYLLNKHDGSGRTFQFYINATGSLVYRDGAVSFLAYDPEGSTSLAVVVEDTVKPQFYAGGNYIGEGNLVSVAASTVALLYIGCIVGVTSPVKHGLTCTLVFDYKLSGETLSDLHMLWEEVQVQLPPAHQIISPPRPHVVLNPLLRIDGRQHGNPPLITDLSGNNLHLTPTNGLPFADNTPSGGEGLIGGGGALDYPTNAQVTDARLDDLVPLSITCECRPDGAHETGGIGDMYAKSPIASSERIALQHDSVNERVNYRERWDGGGAHAVIWNTPTGSAPIGQWSRVTARSLHDGSTPKVSINGVDQALTLATAGPTGSIVTDVGPAAVLDRNAGTIEFNGVVGDVQVFNRYLTDTEDMDLYLRSALRTVDYGYESVYAESLETRIVGDHVGPLLIGSGTHEWNADNQHLCITGGFAHARSDQAYGLFYFKARRDDAANGTRVIIIAGSPDNESDPAQNGYCVLLSNDESFRLRRVTAGARSNIINVAAQQVAGVTYECACSRDLANTMSLWIRGGIHTTWNLVGASANQTLHPTSMFWVNEPDPDDTIWDMHRFPNGMGLTPNDVPWLRDAA